jgi:hypothetical protein
MACRYILPILVIAATAIPARSEPVSLIKVRSEPAAVEVAPLETGRRLLRLPALEFSLEIEPQCDNNMRAESLSISVADTRETVPIAEDDVPVITATLTLPRQQTAPLAVVDFCQAEESPDQELRQLLVRDVFTAHLSLRCTNDEQQSVTYATQSLDLTLLCKPLDQDPSADSTAR